MSAIQDAGSEIRSEIRGGWKLLHLCCSTFYDGMTFPYPVPEPGEKWGPWFRHPEPGKADGEACGPGGWHLMKRLDARYAPSSWWPWPAQGRELLGEDPEKLRFVEVRLRRITPDVLHRCMRPPFNWGRQANLREANLRRADLWRADLREADLREADLWGANLREANLREANLREANLRQADLWGADLREANLRKADLRQADLWRADRRGANLREADLRQANLRGADLWEADLWRARYNSGTLFPLDFDATEAGMELDDAHSG